MLIGYVSDESYVALADVLVEFTNDQAESWEARSRAGGSIHCDLPPGDYLVTLAKPGYGGKRVPDGKLHDLWMKALALEDLEDPVAPEGEAEGRAADGQLPAR